MTLGKTAVSLNTHEFPFHFVETSTFISFNQVFIQAQDVF